MRFSTQVADNQSNQAASLKLLSYNMQVGIGSHSYRDYITQSWRHLLPDSKRMDNLDNMSHWLSDYDLVGLQEVDAGSLRSHFINQVEYLAHHGGFEYWHLQQNRHLGKIAAHSNGILSKLPFTSIVEHKLPGRIKGRGALAITLENHNISLLILSVHLALSPPARRKQLAFIAGILNEYPYFVVMGDMNCAPEKTQNQFEKAGLYLANHKPDNPTFPRWAPKHHFDQIWVSNNLKIISCQSINLGVSDHLPIAMEVALPARID